MNLPQECNVEDSNSRIKMCTNKTQEEFIVIHHEMGHTEYQMSYSVPLGQRPLVFRDGANPGELISVYVDSSRPDIFNPSVVHTFQGSDSQRY